MQQSFAILFAPDGQQIPDAVRRWIESHRIPILQAATADDLMAVSLRSRPRMVVIDARHQLVAALTVCARLKADSFTGIVPVAVCTRADDIAFAAAFDAGGDEVLRDGISDSELRHRLDALLRRSDRDTFVHPSTRLPGAIEIETEITRRLDGGGTFAVCYVDLDHFKEFKLCFI